MYDLIKGLALLPASSILLLAAAVIFLAAGWRRTGLTLAVINLAVLYLLSTPYGAGRLAAAVQAPAPLDLAAVTHDPPGAIVILSAGLSPFAPEYTAGAGVDASTLQRLAYGAALWRRFNIPVLVSGGYTRDAPQSLAFLMKESLEQSFGVPVTWTEDRSKNTLENANFSTAILRDAGVKRVLLVTHAGHMPRSVRVFTQAGLDVVPAPTVFTAHARRFPAALRPSLSAFNDSAVAVYELLGTVWYSAVRTP